MAIFNPILGSMRGRLGANVWSHNKGGDYVRLGTTPSNPQTSRQQTTRTAISTCSGRFRDTLTEAQRDGWNAYAEANPVKNSLGQDVYITGLAWYCKCNCRLLDAGASYQDDAPVGGASSALATLSVDISAIATIDATFTPAIGATDMLQAFVSLPVSEASTPNIRQCRLAGYSSANQTSPWAITTPHGFQVGERGVVYIAVMSAEGLMSAYLQAMDTADYTP